MQETENFSRASKSTVWYRVANGKEREQGVNKLGWYGI